MKFVLALVVMMSGCGRGALDELPMREQPVEVVTPVPVTPAVIAEGCLAEAALPCDQVRATCTGPDAMMVRGHVTQVGDLEGHSFCFAMRYLSRSGDGLDHPYAVVRSSSVIREGRAEACVCMPQGANNYPHVAAVIVRPGEREIRADNTVRAAFGRRYATLGNEGFVWTLTGAPMREEVAAGVAAMDSRGFSLTLRGRSPQVAEGVVRGGLVGGARPLAYDVARGTIGASDAVLRWTMPGRQLEDERVALWTDLNGDGRCNQGDLGAFVVLAGRTEIPMEGVQWANGAMIASVCDALVLNGQGER